MARCLTEKGWNVVLTDDGGFETVDGIPESQIDQWESDIAQCEERFGYDKLLPPPNQEEAEQQFEMLLKVAECVRGLGYPVEDPPSKQSYVAELMNSQLPSWHPYDLVAEGPSLADLEKVEAECPVE